jgi:hypothetical protein
MFGCLIRLQRENRALVGSLIYPVLSAEPQNSQLLNETVLLVKQIGDQHHFQTIFDETLRDSEEVIVRAQHE